MIKLEISRHTGEIDIVEVEHYDVDKITEKRNDTTIEAIAIGNRSFSRINLMDIVPIEEEPLEES